MMEKMNQFPDIRDRNHASGPGRALRTPRPSDYTKLMNAVVSLRLMIRTCQAVTDQSDLTVSRSVLQNTDRRLSHRQAFSYPIPQSVDEMCKDPGYLHSARSPTGPKGHNARVTEHSCRKSLQVDLGTPFPPGTHPKWGREQLCGSMIKENVVDNHDAKHHFCSRNQSFHPVAFKEVSKAAEQPFSNHRP
ncbi:hypothetical protein L218DRAFT_256908 [Marasmius fiardii PR-910]|nr:hypothetical protein L218DRAFT_256908 [Marasmius fiardii PR-910]